MQSITNNTILDWHKIDNENGQGMTVSMTTSVELKTTPKYKAGVFPLFDPGTFSTNIRGGRNKTGGRHSATARFIKGDRKVLNYTKGFIISININILNQDILFFIIYSLPRTSLY